MKIIRIIFFSLLALGLITCFGVFIFSETFDTDQYLPKFIQKASMALGRQVCIGHVGLGLSSRGITLDAGPVIISDDVDFTTQPFIKVDRVRISLDIGSLILRREVHITDILLQSPQIHFIRSQKGNINARSIGSNNRGGRPVLEIAPLQIRRSPAEAVASSLKSTVLKSAPHNDTIKSITIQDASISFIDQSQEAPLDIWLSNINSSLNDFSLSKQSVRISGLRLNTNLSQLDIKDISPGMPSPFKNTAGVVQLNMAHLEIGASGDLAANGEVTITEGVIKNFNIIQTVLSHTLGVFGGMNGSINKLGAEDTVIEKAEAGFSLHDKAVFIDHSLIKTNIFEFTAEGSVDQGLNTDMQTMLHLNGDVSAVLVNEFDGLKYLMDDSKRIAIDASLKGVIPHLKYKPNKDFRKKSKRALIEEGGNILNALWGSGQTSAQGQGASAQDSGKRPKTNFKNILKNFLR